MHIFTRLWNLTLWAIRPQFGSSKAPDPNPGVIAQAQSSERLGMEQIALGREQFAWARDQAAAQQQLLDPVIKAQIRAQEAATRQGDEALQWGKERAASEDAFIRPILEQEARTSAAAAARGESEWERYRTIFQPIEDQYVREAQEFDSPERQARVAGEAGADVTSAFDAEAANRRREMLSYGLDPSSGRYQEGERLTGLERSRATAGAMTQARRQTELQGMAMREGVAKFGRGLPSTGIASDAASIGAGSAAVGGANAATQGAAMTRASALPWYQTGINAGGAAVGGSATSLGSQASAMNTAYPWYAGGANTIGQAGGLYGQDYRSRLSAWQSSEANRSANLSGAGMLIGVLGAAALSDKNLKENRKAVIDKDVLARIRRVGIESWRYKKGIADEGEHIGPMAQDVNKEFGDSVAPGGKLIDMISMHGIALAGIRALADEVERLKEAS